MRSSSHQFPLAARSVEVRLHEGEHFCHVLAELIDSVAERLDAVELLADLAELVLDDCQPAGNVVVAAGRWFALPRRQVTCQYGGQVAWMPVERCRERFERPAASSALCAVVLELADDRLGHTRAVGEFALADVQFGHALVDRLCDRRPVPGQVLLRAPPERRA